LGCSDFGLAASWARAAIHASYSGVPRRGGAPAGMPPIHCGMSARLSPAVFPAQDGSTMHARHRKAQLSIGGNRFIPAWCHAIVAIATPNQGWDGTKQVPLTMNSVAKAFVETGPGSVHAAGFPAAIIVNRLPLPFEQSWIS
jgi:hypothetical protein